MSMPDVRDWTTVAFEDGIKTLRQWREESARRPEEAVEIWEHVLSRHPSALGDELWIVYEQIGQCALDIGRLDLATECVRALAAQFPGNSSRLWRLDAMRFEAVRQFDDALNVYDKLIERDKNNVGAQKRRVAVFKACGRRSEAISALCEYLKTYVNDTEAWTELSNLYLADGDYSRAAHCMEELLLSQPQNSLYLQRYADIKYTHGGLENVEVAKQYYCQAARHNSDNMRALYGILLSCQWLCSKATGQKRRELTLLAAWAAEQLTQKYSAETDAEIAEGHIRCIDSIMNSLKSAATSQ